MRLRNVLITAALSIAPLLAQPRFEVATVRLSRRNFGPYCEGDGASPGRLILRCTTVLDLIQYAFGYYRNGLTPVPNPLQVSGSPGWLDSDRFDIEAKAEGTPRVEMLAGPMLQTLLEDRFKLKVHREVRERRVYVLTVAKGGLKLQPLKLDCEAVDSDHPCGAVRMRSNGRDMTMDAHALSMTDFAGSLGLDRSVIDKTGIPGIFDFHLEFVLDDTIPGTPFGHHGPPPSEEAAGPSIFTAIQQLGLKLESDKGPVEFLVIDHVEKPSEN